MTRLGVLAATATLVLTGAACSGGDTTTPQAQPAATSSSGGETSSVIPEDSSAPPAAQNPTPPGPAPTDGPARLARWFDRDLDGGMLELGAVRERTPSRTSYNVTYRSQGLRISGVLDVPRGRGPHPAVVLAHGYIDPAIYVQGQGMTRERVFLAERGYLALHVDYRNHAASAYDPNLFDTFRLGYAVDVLNAVRALRRTDAVPVDDDRIALAGRSMGGGVVVQALEMAPGFVNAAVTFSSVAVDEADNYRRYAGMTSFWDHVARRWGPPATNPAFYRRVSAARYADRISEPVLIHHGTDDTVCPPWWARRTHRLLDQGGVRVTLAWYRGEGHEFGAQFTPAMERTIRFLNRHLT